MRSTFLGIALIAMTISLTFLGAESAIAERTIGLSSGSFDYLLEPGSAVDGEVTAVNTGDEAFKVLVYTANQAIDADGQKSFVVPSRDVVGFLDSPASWVRIDMPAEAKSVGNTPYLEMEPGDRIPVGFSIATPGGAAPGDRNVVLFFEIFEFNDEQQVNTSEITGRLGTRLQIRVDGDLIEQIDVQPFAVPGFVIGNVIPYDFTVTNSGNINKRINVDMVLLDGDERIVSENRIVSDTPVYTGGTYDGEGGIELPASVFGRHEVVLTMEYPAEAADGQTPVPARVEKSRTVWIVPTWVVFGLAGLVIYIIGVFVWQMAKRAARRRHARERAERRRAATSRRGGRANGYSNDMHEDDHRAPRTSQDSGGGSHDELDRIVRSSRREGAEDRSWGDELDVNFDLRHRSKE